MNGKFSSSTHVVSFIEVQTFITVLRIGAQNIKQKGKRKSARENKQKAKHKGERNGKESIHTRISLSLSGYVEVHKC